MVRVDAPARATHHREAIVEMLGHLAAHGAAVVSEREPHRYVCRNLRRRRHRDKNDQRKGQVTHVFAVVQDRATNPVHLRELKYRLPVTVH